MENDLVKMFLTKDGKYRVKIYHHTYAVNPRFTTDEPLHCCDWEGKHSITNKVDPSYSDARSLINHMLVWYGKREVIIDALCKGIENNRLEYNRSERRWELKEYIKFYSEKEYKWYNADWFDGRKDEIDLGLLVEKCLDSTIDKLCDPKYWTDGIKMMSYSFGYYGGISFSHEFSTNSEGICWLEKDEFLKYSGCKEEYWNGKTLREVEWLVDELKAWGDNEVYGYVVEKSVRVQVMKTYFDGEREDESYIETNWEEVDSCWGYYGELSKNLEYMLSDAGFKLQDLDEVNC